MFSHQELFFVSIIHSFSPGKNCGVVLIARHERQDVGLERCDYGCVRIEEVVIGGAKDLKQERVVLDVGDNYDCPY